MSLTTYSINKVISIKQDVTANNTGIFLPGTASQFDFVLSFDTGALVTSKLAANFGAAATAEGAPSSYFTTVTELVPGEADIITPTFFSPDATAPTYDATAESQLSITFDQTNAIQLFSCAKVVSSRPSGSYTGYPQQTANIPTVKDTLAVKLIEIVALKIFGDARYGGGIDNYPDFSLTTDTKDDAEDSPQTLLKQLVSGMADSLVDSAVVSALYAQMNGVNEFNPSSGSFTDIADRFINSQWQFPIDLEGTVSLANDNDTVESYAELLPVDTWGSKLVKVDGEEFKYTFKVPIQLILLGGASVAAEAPAEEAPAEEAPAE